jgi:hypothetical protein
MNRIVELQNKPQAIKQLAAQAALYSAAKTVFSIQLILGVPVVVAVALAALALDKQWFGLPKKDIAHLVGASGMLFALLDIFMWNPIITRYREQAAKIQQAFDSSVLNLPWNEIAYEKRPDPEDIEVWAKKNRFYTSGSSKYADWYRIEVSELPAEVARLVCQRSNCWWDMDLRRRYNRIIYAIGGMLFVSLVGIAIGLNCTAETFFGLVIAPLLPFLTTGPKLVLDNRDAISRLESMKGALEGAWNQVLQGSITIQELTVLSDDIQGGIFNNRKQNPLIFDWLADKLRPANEEATRMTVEQYVAEFKATHPQHYQGNASASVNP